MKIYGILIEIDKLEREIEAYANENHGLLPDDLSARLDALELDKNKVIEQVYKSVRNKQLRNESFDCEIENLKAKKAKNLQAIERNKEFLKFLIGEGVNHKFGIVDISWRKSEILEIDENYKYPETFYKKKESITLDKAGMKKYIKEGGVVEKAKIVEKKNIQIK